MTAPTATIHVGSYSSDEPAADENAIVAKAPAKESLSGCLPSNNVNGASLQSIIIYLKSSELLSHYDSLALASLVPSLCPGGSLSVHVISDGSEDSKMDWGIIMTSFVLAGLKTESEQRVEGGGRVFTARKAAATATSSAPKLNLGANKLKVTLNLDDDDDDDQIDEDDLLAGGGDGMLAPPPTIVWKRVPRLRLMTVEGARRVIIALAAGPRWRLRNPGGKRRRNLIRAIVGIVQRGMPSGAQDALIWESQHLRRERSILFWT
eukprot:1107164_1